MPPAPIVITRQRILYPILRNDMIWFDKTSNRLFVQYVKLARAMVAQVCSKCGVCMGEYFCDVCKFFDDDRISKEQFHCDDCGICRVGGRDRFFHYQLACVGFCFTSLKQVLDYVGGACYDMGVLNKHSCIENSTKMSCLLRVAHVMRCGHTMHGDCLEQMIKEQQYRCPICSKSALDMSSSWQLLDLEISATEMPSEYNYEIGILCYDCNKEGKAMFHILGHKCGHCGSYNRVISFGIRK